MFEDNSTRYSSRSVDEESHSESVDLGKSEIQRVEVCSFQESYTQYYRRQKKTQPFLTKYEKTKMLGVRAQMLANGAEPLVPVPSHITKTIDIARIEFDQKKIPLLIRRHLPNGTYEDWRLDDLTYL